MWLGTVPNTLTVRTRRMQQHPVHLYLRLHRLQKLRRNECVFFARHRLRLTKRREDGWRRNIFPISIQKRRSPQHEILQLLSRRRKASVAVKSELREANKVAADVDGGRLSCRRRDRRAIPVRWSSPMLISFDGVGFTGTVSRRRHAWRW